MLQSSIASQTAGIKTSGLLKHAPQEFYLRGEQIQRSKASQLAATCANFNKPPLNLKIQKAVLLPGRATPASARHASPPRPQWYSYPVPRTAVGVPICEL